jgi:hypothetical protein
LPVHPGVAEYLSNGDQSFFDQLQEYFYVIGIPLSVAASMAAIFAGHWRSRKLASEQRQILRLLVIADEAAHANSDEIESLEAEFRMIVAACVHKLSEGQGSEGRSSMRAVRSRRVNLSCVLAKVFKKPGLWPAKSIRRQLNRRADQTFGGL